MISKALKSLHPTCEFVVDEDLIEGLKWLSENIPQPTNQEIANEIARLTALVPFQECNKTAKQKIAATDWAVLPDVGLQNKSAFEAYRAELRALIITPVADPQWPTEPIPEWS